MRSRLLAVLTLALSGCDALVGPDPSAYLLWIDTMYVDEGIVVSDVYTLSNTVRVHVEATLQNRGSSMIEFAECGAEGERELVAILVRRSDLDEFVAPAALKEFCPEPTHRALPPGQRRRDSLVLAIHSARHLPPGSAPDPFHVVYLTRRGPLISHPLPEPLPESLL